MWPPPLLLSLILSDLPLTERHVRYTTVYPLILCPGNDDVDLLICTAENGVPEDSWLQWVYTSTVSWHLISCYKIKNIYETLIKQRFKGYCCKSDMPLYKWKVTWNYAYSPFNVLSFEWVCLRTVVEGGCSEVLHLIFSLSLVYLLTVHQDKIRSYHSHTCST